MTISVFERVENIVGKGENAGYQHFLLFPQCFEKASFPDTSKGVIVWEWVEINSKISLNKRRTYQLNLATLMNLIRFLNFGDISK